VVVTAGVGKLGRTKVGLCKLGLGKLGLVKSVDWAVNSVEARRAKAHELK